MCGLLSLMLASPLAVGDGFCDESLNCVATKFDGGGCSP
jgi:hypothetical protein